MSNNNQTNEFFGVDRAVVEAAIVRGRQERAKALRAIVLGLFSRPEASRPDAAAASIQPRAAAHC